ncbi:hypothetical protein L593_01910 [Salinarchaeum sp. Harcht-Bsk1]|uniref:DUF5518 domain-containing protein n=1 Tax=Salinarchaeum sp. Harcht-Bsk1 TaxID=1333523 RepID=UPI0003423820|nr:DUF5518 domain-containing protein [Salinarchaeum sp. Harcht-Bsk1]AGN00333.1 hypothetical protein L593_01910 [Salinarchaeum sp. Harcht-Bsk1]
MGEGDTLLNAVIGGGFTIVTGNLIPLAPVVGGGIAGYLEGGSREDGVRVGVYAGLISLIPVLVFAFLVSSLFGLFGLFAGEVLPGIAGTIFFVVALAFGVLYFVGGAAIGGWLGNYVKYETDVEI